jgi:hypothetical protein
LEGRYNDPVRVIGFNTTERNSWDVSEDVARELRQRCVDQDRRLPDFLQEFMARYQTVKTWACFLGEWRKAGKNPIMETAAENHASGAMGIRGLLICCADYKCSHSLEISADQWPDDVRL